jgi:hypothetical protein
MEQSIHLPTKSRIGVHTKKASIEAGLEIIAATYIIGKKILVSFSNGRAKMVDFEPIFNKYVKGEFSQFAEIEQFRKFSVSGGNLFWGKNEDVIFPARTLYNSKYSKMVEDEIMYVL